MLNGEGNEGGNKINKSNYPKKVTNLHVQHTFLYIYLRLFCTAVASVPVRFHFFTAAHLFSLCWPLGFLIVSPPL